MEAITRMSQRVPGRKVVLPNPLLIKVEFDPKKLAAGRGGPHRYFTARQSPTDASVRINAQGITVSGLPTTGAAPRVIGKKEANTLNVA